MLILLALGFAYLAVLRYTAEGLEAALWMACAGVIVLAALCGPSLWDWWRRKRSPGLSAKAFEDCLAAIPRPQVRPEALETNESGPWEAEAPASESAQSHEPEVVPPLLFEVKRPWWQEGALRLIGLGIGLVAGAVWVPTSWDATWFPRLGALLFGCALMVTGGVRAYRKGGHLGRFGVVVLGILGLVALVQLLGLLLVLWGFATGGGPVNAR